MLKTISNWATLVYVTLIFLVCALVAFPMYPVVQLVTAAWECFYGLHYSIRDEGFLETIRVEGGSLLRGWKAALTGKLFK